MKPSTIQQVTNPLMVFGHPNHEFAVFGSVQRLKPHIIYITDGGGQKRVFETRNALGSIDMHNKAYFMNYPEQLLYDGLLNSNKGLYFEIVNHIQALVDSIKPDAVFCDAMEFYNPLHDITLPLVNCALNRLSVNIPIFEIPLVHQVNTEGEDYRCQRFPESEKVEKEVIELTSEEISCKLHVRERYYRSLVNQMGEVLSSLDADYLGIEVFGKARYPGNLPGNDYKNRYEWRGQLLHERNQVHKVITLQEHFLPFLESLDVRN